jgi:hypothetical protein
MRSDLLTHLQEHIDSAIERHPLRLLVLPFSGAVALGSAGLISNRTLLALTTISGTCVAVVSCYAYLLMQLRESRDLLARRERILRRYVKEMRTRSPRPYTILDWDEHVVINGDGEAMIDRWIVLQAGHEGLRRYASAYFRSEYVPVTGAERARVQFSAHGFNELGEIGTRYDIIEEWEDHKLRVHVLFDEQLAPGEIARILFRFRWPQCYRPLLSGRPDCFDWVERGVSRIERLSATITLSADCNVADRLLLTSYRGSPIPERHRQPDGALVLTFRCAAIPANERVGFGVDVAPRDWNSVRPGASAPGRIG